MAHFLSPEDVKRFYDRIGSRQDWQRFYESSRCQRIDCSFCFRVSIISFRVRMRNGSMSFATTTASSTPNGALRCSGQSRTVIGQTGRRLKPWSGRARACLSHGSPQIPEPDRSFDRFIATYVLDLLAPDFIDQLLL